MQCLSSHFSIFSKSSVIKRVTNTLVGFMYKWLQQTHASDNLTSVSGVDNLSGAPRHPITPPYSY